jgi:phosphoribosyl-ATP pyrophosphohydrolase/phosphoribosyl-AMP cyclohydrolase
MDYKPSFIPTLDISKGQAVLVKKGQVYKYLGDPLEKAKFISINGHFQLVDIDAAKGEGSNKELLMKIVKKYPCYVGGGIRTKQDAIDFLNNSARRVIISTALSPDLLSVIPKDRLIVAFDVNENDKVFKHGRKEYMDKDLFGMIDEFKDNIEMMTVTFHHVEGTNQGIPLEQVERIKKYVSNFNIKLVVAGGINSVQDIKDLIEMDVVPQFGSGFWNGKFTLGDIYECISSKVLELKWVEYKNVRLIPTVVQSSQGIVLGLVFSTPQTIKLSADTRIATFYSRDNLNIWIKGATSGHHHKIVGIHYCCDGTALRFIVEGNKFCHTGSESCFGHNDPARASLRSMQKLLQDRLNTNNNNNAKSYTASLMQDGFKIHSKLLEEAEELVCARNPDDIAHEAADLIYFMLMYLQRQGVDISDVESELIKRRYTVIKDEFEVRKRHGDKFKIGVILNNMPTQFVFEYLEALFNTKIKKETDNTRCMKYICDNPNIMIVQTKPKDIATLINMGILDAVVSYKDIIINYPTNVIEISIPQKKTKHVSIAMVCKDGITLEQLKEKNKTEKLLVMAEYVQLATDWVTENGLIAKITHLSGSAESYLVNDLCDLCVVVYDTGTTLAANGLIVLATLVTTNINLFVHPKKMDMFNGLLKQ